MCAFRYGSSTCAIDCTLEDNWLEHLLNRNLLKTKNDRMNGFHFLSITLGLKWEPTSNVIDMFGPCEQYLLRSAACNKLYLVELNMILMYL